MSLKKQFSGILTVALAVAAFAVAAMAQDTTTPPPDGRQNTGQRERKARKMGFEGHKGRDGMHRGMRMNGLRGIQLTDAQKQQLKALREANKPSPADQELLRSLAEARRNGTLTDDQKAQLKQIRDARRENMRSVHTQILGLLTDEQKAQIEANKAQMKQRREQMRTRRQQLREQRKTQPPPTDQPQQN